MIRFRKAVSTAAAVALSAIAVQTLGTPVSTASGAPITLSVLGIAGWTPSSLALQMAPQFERYAMKHYGVNVKITEASAPFTDLYQKAAASLAARSTQYDIIVSDSQWLGAFATQGSIVRLNSVIQSTPQLRKANNSWASPVVRWSYMTYPYQSQNLYGLPQEGDVLVLYVRKDLVDNRANQKAFYAQNHWALPTTFNEWAKLTWPKFDKIAAFFNKPPHMYGLAMEYSKTYDFMSDHVMSFMWMNGGQIWNRKTHQVYGVLNSPQNNAALQDYVGQLKYQPPGADTYGISEDIQAMTQGKVFSALTWSAVGPAMFTPAMKNKIMAVPPPGMEIHGHFNQIYCLGGQPWVVNRYLDPTHMKVALDFLKWWYLPSTQLEFAKLGGNPVIRQVVDSPSFDKIHPWYRAYKYMLTTAHAQDFWHNPDYAQLLDAQQSAWTAYATGQVKSAKQANTYAACQQQQALYQTGFSSVQPPPSCANVHL